MTVIDNCFNNEITKGSVNSFLIDKNFKALQETPSKLISKVHEGYYATFFVRAAIVSGEQVFTEFSMA